jgi:hypothetical protein
LRGQLSLYTSQNDSHPYVVNSLEDFKTSYFAPEPKNETLPTNETTDKNNTMDGKKNMDYGNGTV